VKSSLKIGTVTLSSLVLALTLLGCQIGDISLVGTIEYVEQLERNLSFEGVESVKLRNVNGNVRITSWEEPRVSVKATKKVWATSEEKAKEYAKEVRIRIEKVGDTIEIVTEHPKGRRPRSIRKASVTYNVTMPKKANLDASSTNGSITIVEITGEISAKTTNGSISIRGCEGKLVAKTTNGGVNMKEVSGNVEAKTVNGGILVRSATLDGESRFKTTNGSIELQIGEGRSAPLTASTTNGSITVGLPSSFAADIEASTVHGHIYSDLPITVVGKISKTSLHGKLNGGGELMRLRTVNGKINVRSDKLIDKSRAFSGRGDRRMGRDEG
jgi:DUF4097 and DUF4098 domain-containing protein YvlB